MTICTKYGTVNDIDLEHLTDYMGDGSYMFTSPDNSLLFGFEIWEDDNNSFHFFVEEGFEDGSADTYSVKIAKHEEEYIKELYRKFKNKETIKGE